MAKVKEIVFFTLPRVKEIWIISTVPTALEEGEIIIYDKQEFFDRKKLWEK